MISKADCTVEKIASHAQQQKPEHILLFLSLRAMFCLEFISVCMYVCMRASSMFILHASSACILHAVHSHSCICLLRGVAYSLGVIAYIWL